MHDELIGKPWGSQVSSHLGNKFFLLQPGLGDLLIQTRRNTQILFPKDIGFILVNMGIGPGQVVVEAGTGSGALTTALAHPTAVLSPFWFSALAHQVGPSGRVITYDVRPEMQQLARKNLARAGLEDRVTFKLRDIRDGFDEQGVEALFLDLSNPETYIPQVRAALKSGGFFGCILPTVNQLTHLIPTLEQYRFALIEVCELLLRYYKPVSERLRPTDRMVAHTGYLVFARPIIPIEMPAGPEEELLADE